MQQWEGVEIDPPFIILIYSKTLPDLSLLVRLSIYHLPVFLCSKYRLQCSDILMKFGPLMSSIENGSGQAIFSSISLISKNRYVNTWLAVF